MSNHSTDKYKVLAFVDGRPGHIKQTQGILNSLCDKWDIDIEYCEVSHNSFYKDLFFYLKLFFLPAKNSKNLSHNVNFVIGTGRRTHLPLLLQKKEFGTPAVVCMSPSFLLRNRFDLCFVPYHDGLAEKDNVFLTTGPPNCSVASTHQKENCGLILVGGTDVKSHNWDDLTIINYVEKIIKTENQKTWTISSSPRTPKSFIRLIEETCKKYKNCLFYRFEDTQSGWIEEQYGMNKNVWVTADSMSMVYEALSAGCSVGLIPMVWKRKNSKFSRSEKHLIQSNIVTSYQDWQDVTYSQHINNRPLNEAQRCAEEITKRWFQKS